MERARTTRGSQLMSSHETSGWSRNKDSELIAKGIAEETCWPCLFQDDFSYATCLLGLQTIEFCNSVISKFAVVDGNMRT
uniref:Uncharacterized protein n=1 Tax=Megaselia scalaris TaxID=36166 RepID=T1GS52_MEGSC